MLAIALVLATRGTCVKRQVGCVLTDSYNRIIGTGYNGVPMGYPHCTEDACPGANQSRGSDTCLGVHAESNALLNCRDVYKLFKCYTTLAPCLRCTKTLLNTTCTEIMFLDGSDVELAARSLWTSSGRIWTQASAAERP